MKPSKSVYLPGKKILPAQSIFRTMHSDSAKKQCVAVYGTIGDKETTYLNGLNTAPDYVFKTCEQVGRTESPISNANFQVFLLNLEESYLPNSYAELKRLFFQCNFDRLQLLCYGDNSNNKLYEELKTLPSVIYGFSLTDISLQMITDKLIIQETITNEVKL